MKKAVCLMLVALLVASELTGCAKTPEKSVFNSQNEILTYERIDEDKTQIIVSSLGNNADVDLLTEAFEKRNPDVQVICIDLTGGTSAYRPIVDWVLNGMAPDVMFVNPDSFVNDDVIAEYFVDLSGSPVIERFEAQSLQRVAVNGLIYFLPAPSEINCLIYNKTLFENYGWSVPATFDEFVALCVQIKEDTGGAVQAWNPNAKYDLVFSTALEAMVYEEVLGGADNRSWYNSFCKGEATFAGHMEPFYAMIQTLIDNGILLEEHFNYSATTRGRDFQDGLLAMYNAPISRMDSEKYEFDYMPYPTTSGKMGYVNNYYSSLLCVPKQEHSEAEQSAIDRYIEFFSSVEGQEVIIGDTMMVSNLKDVPLNENEAMAGIKDVIDMGHMFSRMDFPAAGELSDAGAQTGNGAAFSKVTERTWNFKDNALAMVKGEKTGAEIIAEIDAKPYKTAEESGAGSALKIAEVAEDFTTLEFSCYIADMYREAASADIGLINHGVAYRGNLVRLFAGDIYDSYMFPIKPRSFANDSTLVKLSMTGAQLLEALNHPVGNEKVTDSVYAFSGLKCEIAPNNELGAKYLSAALADGSELEPDKLYTVAAWAGTVADEYITETLESYEGTWEELMAAKLTADGSIAPAADGRITLVWGAPAQR